MPDPRFPGGTEPSSSSPSQSGISEISHLFLSAVRQMHTGPGGPPKRTPPSAAPVEKASGVLFQTTRDVTADLLAAAPSASVGPSTAWLLCGEGGVGGDWKPAAAAWLASQVVAGTAERGALIVIEPRQVHVQLTAAAGEELLAPETLPMSGWSAALAELREDVRYWCIVDLRTAATVASAKPWTACHQWIVWTAPGDAGVVSAYRTLKASAAGIEVPEILIARDKANAEAGVERLREVTERFLSRRVEWLDIDPLPPFHDVEPLPQLTAILTSGPVSPADIDSIARQVAEMAIPPAGGAVSPIVPRMPPPSVVVAPTAPAAPPVISVAIPAGPLPHHVARPVSTSESTGKVDDDVAVQPPASDSSQSENVLSVVECGPDKSGRHVVVALAGQSTFNGSGALRLLDVAVPGMTEARLAVGQAGRVAVVVVATDFATTLAQAGGAMQWLSRSITLLARAFPGLSIDGRQSPELVLLDEGGKLAGIAGMGLLAGNVRIQRFSRIKWGDRTGVVLLAA